MKTAPVIFVTDPRHSLSRTIEVVRTTGGWCELALHGAARELAKNAKIEAFSLSMSHEGDYATAVVVGTLATE